MTQDLQAYVYFLTQDEGGRSTSVNSGYRGQFYYDDSNWDAHETFIGKEVCNPGETVLIDFNLLSPIFHSGKFFINKAIEIREGSRIVARGKITKIYNPNLLKWKFADIKNQNSSLEIYNGDNLKGFIEDLNYNFSFFKDIKKIKITKNTDKFDEDLIIDCQLKNKFQSTRPLIDNIFKSLEEKILLKNYRLRLESVNNKIGYEIFFVTWDSKILSGKITFSNSVYYQYS